jgi:uncharacterized membrane protein
MIILGLFLHILAAVIWVGGMFFVHAMMRPAAGVLDPAVRLPLFHRTLGRFFPWVWGCIAALLISGYGLLVPALGGLSNVGMYVEIMQGLGIIMMLAFAHLYFAPWQRFGRALAAGDLPGAGAQLNKIRQIVTFNLALGLIVVVVGATGPYWG